MTASAKTSISTMQSKRGSVDRLALIKQTAEARKARATERVAAKEEREAFTAHLAAKADVEDQIALAQCHVIINRIERRGAEARNRTKAVAQPGRRRGRAQLAPRLARDVEVDVADRSVPDPYAPGSYHTTTVNRRVDVLAQERGRLTEAQFLVGRMIQAVFERGSGARLGSAGWDVSGSRDQTIAHELQIIYALDDAERVRKFERRLVEAIGSVGARFLRAVLTEGWTFARYAEARGKSGERAAAQVGAHFRLLLEGLTEAQHTAHGPRALPRHDRYAGQADTAPARQLAALQATAAARAEAAAQKP